MPLSIERLKEVARPHPTPVAPVIEIASNMGSDVESLLIARQMFGEAVARVDQTMSQLRECGLDPKFLFGDGLSAVVRDWPPDGDEYIDERQGFIKGAVTVSRISLPTGDCDGNWLIALREIISRREEDNKFGLEIATAFGINKVIFENGLPVEATLDSRRGGIVGTWDAFRGSSLTACFNGEYKASREEKIADLATLAFVPANCLKDPAFKNGFVIARPKVGLPHQSVYRVVDRKDRVLRVRPIKEDIVKWFVNNSRRYPYPLFILNLHRLPVVSA